MDSKMLEVIQKIIMEHRLQFPGLQQIIRARILQVVREIRRTLKAVVKSLIDEVLITTHMGNFLCEHVDLSENYFYQ